MKYELENHLMLQLVTPEPTPTTYAHEALLSTSSLKAQTIKLHCFDADQAREFGAPYQFPEQIGKTIQ